MNKPEYSSLINFSDIMPGLGLIVQAIAKYMLCIAIVAIIFFIKELIVKGLCYVFRWCAKKINDKYKFR